MAATSARGSPSRQPVCRLGLVCLRGAVLQCRSSPYPDRIEPKLGLSEADLKALQKRTLTNLYNQRPAWLHTAHETLDAAVAAAYGWFDYTPTMTDDESLQRLLALNLARAAVNTAAKSQ